MKLATLLVAILVDFGRSLDASSGPDLVISRLPDEIGWGCYYPVVLSGGDGTNVTVDLLDQAGTAIYQLYKGRYFTGHLDYLPLPDNTPVGKNYRLRVKDANSLSTNKPFNLIAAETPPSDCEGPRVSTTFSVPSTSSTSKASSTASSATTSSTTSSSSTSSAKTSLPSSSTLSASTSSMTSTSRSMGVSVPTATPTTSVGTGGVVSCRDLDPRVPEEWKCRDESTCISLDDASSAICCNDHVANCTTIFALDCDIQRQNATAHPESPVFTTWLDAALPSCGHQCCPFGYYCHHSESEVDWHCLMATSSSSINLTAEELVRKPKASAPPAANATATDMYMPAAIATLRPGDTTQSGSTMGNGTNPSNKPLSGGSVAGIAVGACAGLALFGAAVFWIIRRRKKQNKGGSDDLDIKPYEFTAPQGGGIAAGSAGGGPVNSRFSEAYMSDGTGYHVEKDGQPIQSPTLSPYLERDNQPILSREESSRRAPIGVVHEMA